ncbi:helix-turn-helix domain-containing protein [Paenibacillus sp. sgz500992]|uniref:helix-turn-helix domain-containing protein n=1 Tax=Paenibacillus sp. sgz500992 TaxID=3242476 RepID=UPI0036D33BBF
MLGVLIVDDELLMRIGLKSIIQWEEEGFTILGEAANGREALELAGIHRPDLIITDIKMPVMDGIELIREAQRLDIGGQFVILSCLEEFQYAQEAVRLGATDYLIKSDMKPAQLSHVLEIVKKRAVGISRSRSEEMPPGSYKESIEHLKETLFKELISGFRDAGDVLASRESLRIRLTDEPMVLVKLRINDFEQLRRKYVEQDEKLLRYSVTNILEEILPRKRAKEIIVLNSAEYVLLLDLGQEGRIVHGEIEQAVDKIQAAMRDFLKLTMSIGVSGTAPGFAGLKRAYQEADEALDALFFKGGSGLSFYDQARHRKRGGERLVIDRSAMRKFRQDTESGSEGAAAYLNGLKDTMLLEGCTKQNARSIYMRLLAAILSCFPALPEPNEAGITVYESILHEESLEGLHQAVTGYLEQCRAQMSERDSPRSYAEQASDLIMQLYAEDISLQGIADRINVNASYLSRVFKQETGENFVNFLTRLRMEKAKSMLREKNMRVYEVAERVGYPNTAYFSKLFKKLCGMTPEEYRG